MKEFDPEVVGGFRIVPMPLVFPAESRPRKVQLYDTEHFDRDTRIEDYFRFRADLERELGNPFVQFFRAMAAAFLACIGFYAAFLLAKKAMIVEVEMDGFAYTMAAIMLVYFSLTAFVSILLGKDSSPAAGRPGPATLPAYCCQCDKTIEVYTNEFFDFDCRCISCGTLLVLQEDRDG